MFSDVKSITRISICIGMLLGVSACASSGNSSIEKETSSSIDAKIIDGQTTKSDIKQAFGDPEDVDYKDKNTEVWKYVFSKSHYAPFAMKAFQTTYRGNKKTLTILFDGNIVQHHNMSASDFENSSSNW